MADTINFLEIVPDVLTPYFVRDAVAEIRGEAHDDEGAHVMEDDLYAYVLDAIARGKCSDPAACAAETLKTKAIKFERWCA